MLTVVNVADQTFPGFGTIRYRVAFNLEINKLANKIK